MKKEKQHSVGEGQLGNNGNSLAIKNTKEASYSHQDFFGLIGIRDTQKADVEAGSFVTN